MSRKQASQTKNVPVSRDTSRTLSAMSKKLHRPEEEVVAEALRYYAKALENERALTEEMKKWERVSDEDLAAFEKAL